MECEVLGDASPGRGPFASCTGDGLEGRFLVFAAAHDRREQGGAVALVRLSGHLPPSNARNVRAPFGLAPRRDLRASRPPKPRYSPHAPRAARHCQHQEGQKARAGDWAGSGDEGLICQSVAGASTIYFSKYKVLIGIIIY